MNDANSDGNTTLPSDDKPFNFLGLPKELRFNVYDYVLKPCVLRVFSYSYRDDDDNIPNLSDPRVAQTGFYGTTREMELCPQLLRTCKTVHEEAGSILYNPTHLELAPSFRWGPPDESERKFDATKLTRIRRLDTLEVDLYTISVSKEVDMLHSRALVRCVHPNLAIRKCSLHIRENDEFDHDLDDGVQYNLKAIIAVLKTWKGVLKAKNYDAKITVNLAEDIAGKWCKMAPKEWEEDKMHDDSEMYQGEHPDKCMTSSLS